MNVKRVARDVGVSSEELIEILQDIQIDISNEESELTNEQIEKICDELGYNSIHEAREDNSSQEEINAGEEQETISKESSEEHGLSEENNSEDQKKEDDIQEEQDKDQKTIELKKPKVVVKDFAEMLALKPNLLIAELMRMNIFASINAEIDFSVAKKIGEKYDFVVTKEERKKNPSSILSDKKNISTETKLKQPIIDPPESLKPRPPVVTFMGHVDHGKTSLLDFIRDSQLVKGESGGITQHIGAYTVDINDQKITFLDTPGHAAFTSMRARGANLTDIVILVVAADDGIMPQTLEALKHAQAADVCIIIAINKMDLPAANPDKIKQQLQENDIMVEDWGGSVGCCEVSAVKGDGIGSLLERILLESEMLELKANPDRSAQGYVVEAQMEPGMGPTASVLIMNGTLSVGDSILCGKYWGRVKALINDKGAKVRSAAPSAAVKILGLVNVPDAGDEFEVIQNEREAKRLSAELQDQDHKISLEEGALPKKASLDDLFNTGNISAENKDLRIIIKADVQGSIEAIEQSLNSIASDKVNLSILSSSVGNITVNDVMLASASNAIILGFHAGKESGAVAAAKKEGVEIRLYSIIYELIQDVESAMQGLLDPELKEQVIGEAEVLEVFEFSKKSKIAGCMIISGRVTSKCSIRIKRNSDIIFEGRIGSLKRFQNDANEVKQGQECGIRPDNFIEFEVGDIIEAFVIEKIEQSL